MTQEYLPVILQFLQTTDENKNDMKGFNPVLNIAHGAILLFIFELQLLTFKNLIGNMTGGLRISLLVFIINRTFKSRVHTQLKYGLRSHILKGGICLFFD